MTNPLLLHRLEVLSESSRGSQYEADSDLSDRRAEHVGCVRELDAASLELVHCTVVVAG